MAEPERRQPEKTVENTVHETAPPSGTADERTRGTPKDEKTATSASSDEEKDVPITTATDTVYSTFGKHQKRFIITMTSIAALVSPMSAQIYFPALQVLAEHYDATTTQINLTVTTYFIVQGLAPSFMGNFADIGGRRPAYVLSFTIYLLANLGLALQDHYAALLVLRGVQSAGSSATVSIGYGVAADIASAGERGRYMGSMSAGLMTALSLGPLLGGVLSRGLGWRSVFWFLVIVSGSYLTTYIITMPETSRRLVGNGSVVLKSPWRMSGLQYLSSCRDKKTSAVEQHGSEKQDEQPQPKKKGGFALFNPFSSLIIFKDKAASINIWHLGFLYSATVAIQTSTANLFGNLYGLNPLEIGLCFLPCGVFGCVGSATMGMVLDMNYRRVARKLGHRDPQNFPFEKARLQVAIPLSILMSAVLIVYGWVLEQHVHLAGPLILQAIIGFCSSALMSVIGTLLVDIFPEKPATANAAANLVRCWLGAVTAAVLEYMFARMGWGWSFVAFGLLMLAAVPVLWVEYQRGLQWRKAKKGQEE